MKQLITDFQIKSMLDYFNIKAEEEKPPPPPPPEPREIPQQAPEPFIKGFPDKDTIPPPPPPPNKEE